MSLRTTSAIFFLFYGALIPIAAYDFTAGNPVATLAMIGSCFVIAALLWSGRAPLVNILVAIYVFKVYLTRPYISTFLPKLEPAQFDYISSLNSFFSAPDAAVVYLSLLSLLLAWLCGLLLARPRQINVGPPPWIFRQVDMIVASASWQFWLVWVLLFVLNFKSATSLWQGIATGTGEGLFAFGLFSTATIDIVCLYAFMISYQFAISKALRILLLVPALVDTVIGSLSGGRSAIFLPFILVSSYWLFLNFDRHLDRRIVSRILPFILMVPFVFLVALFAQTLRPLLRSGVDPDVLWTATLGALDFSNPYNPIVNTFYFGLSELLSRMSGLLAQFMILNDYFVHDPWESYNPLWTLARIFNDLMPGDPIPNVLTINQLFNYIYYDNSVVYNSEMWSIQGTLFLYFGFWISPVVVFWVAYGVGRQYDRLALLVKSSPAFAVFFVLLFNDLIENGTFERVVPVDIVRPLTSFLALIFLVKLLGAIVPEKQRLSVST